MKRIAIRALTCTLVAFPLALAVSRVQSRPVLAQEQQVQVIEITAKKYEFPGSPVHVKAGTKVQLKVTATDRDHGIKINATPDGADASASAGLVFTSPQECWMLKKGETVTIEFVAKTAGTYTLKCCHHCGLGHHGMKGQLVVE